MADVKISALSAATALAGTEVLPVVQGGATVKATAAQVSTYALSAMPNGFVTDAKASLANKPASTVVATTNQALTGTPTIDGQATAAGSVILLTAQSTGSQNGPWIAAAGAWARPTWYPSGGTTQAFQFITTFIRLGTTYQGSVWRMTTSGAVTIDTTATTWVVTPHALNASTVSGAITVASVTSPLAYNSGTRVLSMPPADASTNGYMSSALVNILNNKQDIGTSSNYDPNQSIEVNANGYNTYDDIGRTTSAFVVEQDLKFTSALSGGSGNGVVIQYIYNAGFPSATPDINVVSAALVQVRWNNGPTVANNPTATQLKAAWDAVPGALAVATVAITGTAGNRQYITGSHSLADGGDAAPSDGTSGSPPTGVTVTRTTVSPLVGTGSLLISKDAANRQGTGVSIDLSTLNAADLGQRLQISFYYNAPVGFTVGSASDIKVYLYDITNAAMIPISARNYLLGPTTSTIRFAGTFTASATSSQYRLIWHIGTTNATAWDLRVDEIIVNNTIDASAATQVPKIVLDSQVISGSVTDHMAVMWLDGASSWIPATQNGNGDASVLMGFATNIVGLTASITTQGLLNGFSVGPFAGYDQYIDNTAGSISPAPATFTDTYWTMGKGLTTDSILVQPKRYFRLVTSKGGILSNGGLNNGTGDAVVAGGTTGQILRYNTGLTNGFSAFTPLCTAPLVYTAATSTWSIPVGTGSVAGYISAADFTIFAAKLTSTLTSANIFVGNGSNVATGVAMSGHATISNAGVVTITSGITNSSSVAGATVTAALDTLNQQNQEVYLSAIKNAGSVTANTAIATWTTESKDTLNAFDPSTGIFTVPSAGDYRISFSAATTTGTPVAQVYKNAALAASGIGSGSGVRTYVNAILPNCVAGDTITVALDSSLTLTSTATDTLLNIIKETGLSSTVVTARRHSATATITSSLSNVTYSTSDFDSHSAYSGSTYTIPAGASGLYRVDASLYITATTVTAGQAQVLALLKNGVEFARYTTIAAAATAKPFQLVINDIFNFTAADTLTVQVSSASTTPVMSASTMMNRFSVVKLSN